MTLFADNPPMTDEEAEQLFSDGVSLLLGRAYPAAYSCFDRIPVKDFRLLYNKALCCFMVKWYEECYRLLCEAEHLITGIPLAGRERVPEAFLRYGYEEESPFCPIPQGTPVVWAYTLLLRLKAETAFKLHLYREVKVISSRLGGKYRHIEELIFKIDNDDL